MNLKTLRDDVNVTKLDMRTPLLSDAIMKSGDGGIASDQILMKIRK